MKAFGGYEAKKAVAREQLPVGGYVAKIMNVEVVKYDWAQFLRLDFDITEGTYKDFFKKDYANQTGEDTRWRGNFRLRIPEDDGTEQDGWSKRTFGNAMWAVESSNDGYHWNWDEETLKGKTVGVLFRNEEWAMNGNTGWNTKCCALTSAEDIRNSNFKMPKDKPLKDKPVTSAAAIKEESYTGTLPWE